MPRLGPTRYFEAAFVFTLNAIVRPVEWGFVSSSRASLRTSGPTAARASTRVRLGRGE